MIKSLGPGLDSLDFLRIALGNQHLFIVIQNSNLSKPLVLTWPQLLQQIQAQLNITSGSTIDVRDEGSVIDATAQFLNFIGTGVTVTQNGTGVDIDIPGGGGAVDSVNGQTGIVVLALDDLSDVNAPSPSVNQILQWNGTEWVPATVSTTAIDGANSRRWTGLNTNSAPTPGTARLRTTAGATTNTPSAVIDIRISRYDETNADMQAWFTALNNYRTANPSKAYIQITDSSDNSVFGIYQIGSMAYTSSPIQYWTIGLTYISGSVGLFSNGSTITFSWVLFGADGTASTPDLQQVTDVGSTTTNTITVGNVLADYSQVLPTAVGTQNAVTGTYAYIDSSGFLGLHNTTVESQLLNTNVTNIGVQLEFPNKPTGSYTIATTADLVATDIVSPFLLMGG